MTPSTTLEASTLTLGRQLGSGGQGIVYQMHGTDRVVKIYKRPDDVDAIALSRLPPAFANLPVAARDRLAGPERIVTERGRTVGFTMPAIGPEFMMDRPDGTHTPRDFQHLLNGPEYAVRMIGLTSYTQASGYQLLLEFARVLDALHRNGIVAGDISPKNVLFAFEPRTAVYLIDCDSMIVNDASVFSDVVDTPGWAAPEHRKASQGSGCAPTPESDSYKLGLLTLRLLAGDQSISSPSAIPRVTPGSLRALIESALDSDPRRRAKPADWLAPLTHAASTATTFVAEQKVQQNQPTFGGVVSRYPQTAKSPIRGSTVVSSTSAQHPTSTPSSKSSRKGKFVAIALAIVAVLYVGDKFDKPSVPVRVANPSITTPTTSTLPEPAAEIDSSGRLLNPGSAEGGSSCSWIRVAPLGRTDQGPYGPISNEIPGTGCVNMSHDDVLAKCRNLFSGTAGTCAFYDPDSVLRGRTGRSPTLVVLRAECLTRAGQTTWGARGVSDDCIAAP